MIDVTWNSEPPSATRQPRRRWLLILAALAAVLAIVAISVAWWSTGTGESDTRPDWQPPSQTLLASSMLVRPVPGWRANATDLGLLESEQGVAAMPRIATSEDPFESHPFIGNLGNDAYFVAGTFGGADTRWSLVGIDVGTGQR